MAEQLPDATGAVTIKPPENTTDSTEAPVVGFPLKVEGPEGVSVVYTDDEGKWTLYNLPAGNYSVEPLTGVDENSATKAAEFSVKKTGFFERLVGSQAKSIVASDIQLSTESTMPPKSFVFEK